MLTKKMSTGESIILNYLVTHGYPVRYGKAYHFLDGLHGDIFIPSCTMNPVPTIIEYDGSQHFNGIYDGINKLNRITADDTAKDALCILHHVHLIRLEDMESLSTNHYTKAIKKINKLLDEELPVKIHGISIRFVSMNLKDLSRKYISQNSYIHGDAQSVQTPSNIVSYVESKQTISVSELQERFSFGFNRAHMTIESLANKGIVSHKDGSKPRIVLVHHSEDSSLTDYLDKISDDPVTKSIVKEIKNYNTISISQLQRIYEIGYNRARKIMFYLTQKKLVSKPRGAHKRVVLVAE